MRADISEHIEQLLKRPMDYYSSVDLQGSGKTATLYAMLRMLNLEEKAYMS